jgi:spore germination protein KB
MSDKMKISSSQIFWMITSMEIGMTILLTIAPAIRDAKQDAWISMIIGGGASVLISYIYVKASLLYPNQTLIEFSQTILGKWLGKIIVIPYFIMWYSVLGIILREASDFLHLSLFYLTPLSVVAFSLIIVIVYMTYSGGIETIARCSEIFGPLILVTLAIVTILSVNNIRWNRIFPIYADTGWFDILKGSLPMTSFMAESAMILMLVPFVAKQDKVMTRTLWGVGISSIFIFFTTLSVILTFGIIAADMWYPFNRMIRFISIMEFIQNVDTLVVILWLLSVFIKLGMYLFITSYGTAQWLGIKNWRILVWFVAGVSFFIAIVFPDIDAAGIDYPVKVWMPYIFPINLISIPLLLWVIGSIQKKIKSKKGHPAQQ